MKDESQSFKKMAADIPQLISEFFPEDQPLSQDDVMLFGGLTDLLENCRKKELAQFFKTEEARASNSRARQLIESAV